MPTRSGWETLAMAETVVGDVGIGFRSFMEGLRTEEARVLRFVARARECYSGCERRQVVVSDRLRGAYHRGDVGAERHEQTLTCHLAQRHELHRGEHLVFE